MGNKSMHLNNEVYNEGWEEVEEGWVQAALLEHERRGEKVPHPRQTDTTVNYISPRRIILHNTIIL